MEDYWEIGSRSIIVNGNAFHWSASKCNISTVESIQRNNNGTQMNRSRSFTCW